MIYVALHIKFAHSKIVLSENAVCILSGLLDRCGSCLACFWGCGTYARPGLFGSSHWLGRFPAPTLSVGDAFPQLGLCFGPGVWPDSLWLVG